ncbi:MAG TPA: hypothetical protein VFA81_08180 [Burkholderiales bacterium]|nr:hypothetical protein [Burkholderiales bacterium]
MKRYAPRLFEEAGREGFGTGLPIELLCVYCSHEHAVERLVRSAWTDRTVITVFALRRRPDHPVAIMLRRAPEPFQH